MIAQVAIANTKRSLVRPQSLSKSVWIDASDYDIGTLADGTVLTNKGNPAIVFEVEGSTLAVQLNAQNKKEFVFDGSSYIRCTSGVADFTKYKDGSIGYSAMFIGKIGTTANPDAVYSICGNAGFSSVNHGFYIGADNRVATASTDRGYQHSITRGSATLFCVQSRYNTAQYNTRRSLYFVVDNLGTNLIDGHRLFADSDLEGVTDRVRTSANTTSGLGGVNAFSGIAPTYAFEIGASGNGVVPFVGKMEQFALIDSPIEINQVYGLDEYFQVYNQNPLSTTFQRLSVHQSINDDYVHGGAYGKNEGKTKTIFYTSVGPNHFTVGSDRDLKKLVSPNNITTFPTSYTTVTTDASNAFHNPAGGYTPTGRFVVLYGRFNSTTGVYNGLMSQYSDDDGTTFSTPSSITVPTTSPALTYYVPHDKLVVCNNGDIAIPLYAASGTSLYNLYICRSSDDGITWSLTEIFTSGSTSLSEISITHLGGNDWISMVRLDVAVGGFFEYKMLYSSDDMATFSDEGNTDFNLNYVYAHPPMLRTIFIDGSMVIEFSWINRGTRRWHMRYALPADLITNGPTAWNTKTLYTMDTRGLGGVSATGWRSGYPVIVHPNNDLKFEGVWFEENSPTETDTWFVKMGDLHKGRIKSDLGI